MKVFINTLFIMNMVSLLGGILYSFFPGESLLWNSYGLLLLATLASNIVASVIGSRYKILDIAYLLLSSIGLLAVMVLNTVASFDPANEMSRSIVSVIILLLLFIIGSLISSLSPLDEASQIKRTIKSAYIKESRLKKTARRALLALLFFCLLFAGFMAFVMITPNSGLVEVLISQFSLFYSFVFLAIAGLVLKFSIFKWQSPFTYVVSVIGVGLFVVFALPFLSIPSLLHNAEENYTEAFGDEWENYGDNVSEFKQMPISIPAYLFGISSENYYLTEDVLFYEGTDGIDEGLELRFDVYMPPENESNLPGEGSTLIRIHGGGWDTGDKGAGNFAQVNKYFAAQGYVVFDVQYGLNDQDQFVEFASVADEVSGNFSIDDMVRHLGLFTTYLADNHEAYGASIESVFVSGGSAGGQLGNAVALGLASGEYTDILDERLSVSGIIPVYPANGLPHYRNLDGEDELLDPALLVDVNSPPALVYHGDKDGIVDPQVSENFREAYLENENTEIAIIYMPFGAHGSDMYFPGFYNQTFIYYMERFMYHYREMQYSERK